MTILGTKPEVNVQVETRRSPKLPFFQCTYYTCIYVKIPMTQYKSILHREIQQHKSGHDSKEDALAALDLIKFKVAWRSEQEAILHIGHHPQFCAKKCKMWLVVWMKVWHKTWLQCDTSWGAPGRRSRALKLAASAPLYVINITAPITAQSRAIKAQPLSALPSKRLNFPELGKYTLMEKKCQKKVGASVSLLEGAFLEKCI